MGASLNNKELIRDFTKHITKEEIFMIKKSALLCLCLTVLSVYGCTKALAVKFAVVGDYGDVGDESRSVAKLIKSWEPDFVLTVGDNNYPSGGAETIDECVGSLYSTYVYPYKGKYEASSIGENRFFPCMGNHDFDTELGKPYLDYFALPGNGHYYDFVKEDIHFFSVSSDHREPGGIQEGSPQIEWLKEGLKNSSSPWKVVYFHHPAYSSMIQVPPDYKKNIYSKNRERRILLPFEEWGVSAVLNGHLHIYERFDVKGVPHVTNGLGGGKVLYNFCDPEPESLVRFTGDYGAMLAETTNSLLTFKFISVRGEVVDEFSIPKKK